MVVSVREFVFVTVGSVVVSLVVLAAMWPWAGPSGPSPCAGSWAPRPSSAW